MDFLGIKESAVSRPSLISSMWSLQVQPQQDVTTIMDIQMGSQQSLPDMPTSTQQLSNDYLNFARLDQSNAIRPSKSLSELSQFCKDSRMFCIHEAPSFVWKRSTQTNNDSAQLRAPHSQDLTLSKQQKERNICEWLEQLNCGEKPASMVVSPNSNTSPVFLQQLNSPSLTASQFSKPTPMQH